MKSDTSLDIAHLLDLPTEDNLEPGDFLLHIGQGQIEGTTLAKKLREQIQSGTPAHVFLQQIEQTFQNLQLPHYLWRYAQTHPAEARHYQFPPGSWKENNVNASTCKLLEPLTKVYIAAGHLPKTLAAVKEHLVYPAEAVKMLQWTQDHHLTDNIPQAFDLDPGAPLCQLPYVRACAYLDEVLPDMARAFQEQEMEHHRDFHGYEPKRQSHRCHLARHYGYPVRPVNRPCQLFHSLARHYYEHHMPQLSQTLAYYDEFVLEEETLKQEQSKARSKRASVPRTPTAFETQYAYEDKIGLGGNVEKTEQKWDRAYEAWADVNKELIQRGDRLGWWGQLRTKMQRWFWAWQQKLPQYQHALLARAETQLEKKWAAHDALANRCEHLVGQLRGFEWSTRWASRLHLFFLRDRLASLRRRAKRQEEKVAQLRQRFAPGFAAEADRAEMITDKTALLAAQTEKLGYWQKRGLEIKSWYLRHKQDYWRKQYDWAKRRSKKQQQSITETMGERIRQDVDQRRKEILALAGDIDSRVFSLHLPISDAEARTDKLLIHVVGARYQTEAKVLQAQHVFESFARAFRRIRDEPTQIIQLEDFAAQTQEPYPFLAEQARQTIKELKTPWAFPPFPAVIRESDRARNTYVTGAIGSGKTELMKVLIHEYVKRPEYGSIVILDPHKDFSSQVAQWVEMRDPERLVFFEPNLVEGHFPVLNPFAVQDLSETNVERAAQQFYTVFADMTRDAGLTMQMQAVLIPCICVVIRLGGDLQMLQRFMVKGENEDLITAGLRAPNPNHAEFFRTKFRADTYASTRNGIYTRLLSFLNNQAFYRMLTGEATVDLQKAMDTPGKVIVFNMPLGDMGEAGIAFGRFVVAMIQTYGLQRQRQDENKRVPCNVFIDEAANYVGSNMEKILNELRKYRVQLTLAQQTYGQNMNADMKRSVVSSTAVKLTGSNEPTTLNKIVADTDVAYEDLKILGKGKFSLHIKGKPAYPVQVSDHLLGKRNQMSDAEWEQVKAQQITRYYRDVTKIPPKAPVVAPVAAQTRPTASPPPSAPDAPVTPSRGSQKGKRSQKRKTPPPPPGIVFTPKRKKK